MIFLCQTTIANETPWRGCATRTSFAPPWLPFVLSNKMLTQKSTGD
jgi:hypothetical protein